MTTKSVTDDSFEKDVLHSNLPILVDFWAEWCGPCKQIESILEEIAEEKLDQINVVKINIDENPKIPEKYSVRGIPTLMLFVDGQLKDTKVGSMPKSLINEWVNSIIN